MTLAHLQVLQQQQMKMTLEKHQLQQEIRTIAKETVRISNRVRDQREHEQAMEQAGLGLGPGSGLVLC